MTENISDVTVNISIDNPVNPAAFGGLCLYSSTTSETVIPYTEIYNIEEADEKITEKEEELTADKANALKNAVKIAFMQETPPEKVAVLRCPVAEVSKYDSCDYRYLLPINEQIGTIKQLAETIETGDSLKMLGVCLNYEEYAAAKSELDKLTKEGYSRTFVYVGVKSVGGSYELNQITTALIAKTSCKSVGSFTYKNQVLKGVNADEAITKADLKAYHDANINAFVKMSGSYVTSEGVCLNGEYIDIMDTKDWLITQIQYQEQQILINNDKIPYDNTGIALLESVCVNVLQDAFNNGIIATDENGKAAYSVDFKPRSETKASDREKRKYVEGHFSFELAGAIHTLVINGVIMI